MSNKPKKKKCTALPCERSLLSSPDARARADVYVRVHARALYMCMCVCVCVLARPRACVLCARVYVVIIILPPARASPLLSAPLVSGALGSEWPDSRRVKRGGSSSISISSSRLPHSPPTPARSSTRHQHHCQQPRARSTRTSRSPSP